ncbi:MAG: response regulator [Candidatus Eisenbacteria bacterium]|nr:response regulator [Candidatus Eisenbacteria bacterium]
MEQIGTNRTVMVVDDDLDFLETMKLRLEGAGFRVLTAESVPDAEAILDETRPDLAIIDLMMEHIDSGFTLAHKIKRKDPSIPVIMITGVTAETGLMFETDTKRERSWTKADVLLDKPIRFEQLEREMARLLRRGE